MSSRDHQPNGLLGWRTRSQVWIYFFAVLFYHWFDGQLKDSGGGWKDSDKHVAIRKKHIFIFFGMNVIWADFKLKRKWAFSNQWLINVDRKGLMDTDRGFCQTRPIVLGLTELICRIELGLTGCLRVGQEDRRKLINDFTFKALVKQEDRRVVGCH